MNWQLRSGGVHCHRELAVEICKAHEEEKEKLEEEAAKTAMIKSENPHLAGRKNMYCIPCWPLQNLATASSASKSCSKSVSEQLFSMADCPRTAATPAIRVSQDIGSLFGDPK